MIQKKEFSKSGIYKIINIINNKIYVGSSINMYQRIHHHVSELKRQKHCSPYLQKVFNKYKLENLNFEIIEYCDKEDLINREQYYIDNLKPDYNICKIAGSLLGVKKSEASKLKQSLSMMGKKQSVEHVLKRIKNRKVTKPKFNYLGKCSIKGYKRSKESIEKQISKRQRAILQLDINNNLINEFISIKEAEAFVKDRQIWHYCNNKRKDLKGYIWKYKSIE